MAVSPKELNQKRAEAVAKAAAEKAARVKAEADGIERHVDQVLRERYAGGEVVVPYADPVPPDVLGEVGRRYGAAGWKVAYGKEGFSLTPKEESPPSLLDLLKDTLDAQKAGSRDGQHRTPPYRRIYCLVPGE
jgi:hypothetical protein